MNRLYDLLRPMRYPVKTTTVFLITKPTLADMKRDYVQYERFFSGDRFLCNGPVTLKYYDGSRLQRKLAKLKGWVIV